MPYSGRTVVKKNKNLVQLGAEHAKPLFGMSRVQLAELVAGWGEPKFRAKQLAEALYSQRVGEIAEMTTLPKPLRERMAAEGYVVGRPRIEQVFSSIDGTERYLVECPGPDQKTVETVWMPEGDFFLDQEGREEPDGTVEPSQRATICVSSQVGCAVGCEFCLTAKLGLERNLTAGEIAGQVIAVLERHAVAVGKDRVNLVFMGMGEPFLNYANFMAAVRLLVQEAGLSAQRMTVSTSGIVPGIEQFALEPAEVRPKLALSLNAPNDQVRGEIMPINRKWPLEAVLGTMRKVRLRHRERLTFEYVLLGGVTDQLDHARQVARLARRSGLPIKVNLIAWNPGPGVPYATPAPEAVEAFKQELVDAGISTYLRRPRGRDIYAACGQLKRTVEG
jgi:23S rRNA (adenine2503-C2)-methyltransferase